jgi:hypothetical protein
MRLVHRFKTGLTLTRDSLTVLRKHPDLMLFPFFGGIATLAFGAVIYLTVFVGNLIGGGLEYVALFAFYFATTFVASFCTAALVSSVDDVFHGREPTFRGGMAAAWEMKTELAVWSVISAVVGVILRSLERSDSMLTRIVAGFFALGWTITTFFVIPVIVFEDVSVDELFSKSADTFRETWGETLSSNFGIGLVQFVLWLAGMGAVVAIGVGLFALVPAVGTTTVVLGAIGVTVGVYLVGQTVQGITKTALYVYASERTIPPEFDDFDFESLDGRTEGSTGRKRSSTMTSFK